MAAEDRRPLASRQTGWAKALSGALARSSITPNQISVASVAVAAVACVLLIFRFPVSGPALVAAAVFIQLRLLCNLLDGMVAIEGGKQTPTGALYNEFPDRLADSFILVGLGFAAGTPALGWFGALAAMGTAYVRQTGAGLGFGHDFSGIQSKPRRMFVATLACLLGAAEGAFWGTQHVLMIAVGVIALGSAITCVTRSLAIARQLNAKDAL